jgi:heme-degrading monooxygenase HmoA
LTYTEFERFRDMPAAGLAALRLRRAFPSTEGAIGLSLAMQPLARRSWSISAWETEEHLQRFVRSPAHVAIVRQFRPKMRVESTAWTVDLFRLKEAWRTATQRRKAGSNSN